MKRSIVQGVNICGAWHWRHEDACSSVFEERNEHRVDEESKSLVRSQRDHESGEGELNLRRHGVTILFIATVTALPR